MGIGNGVLVDGEKELHESAERAAGKHHDFNSAFMEAEVLSGGVSEGDAWEWGIDADSDEG